MAAFSVCVRRSVVEEAYVDVEAKDAEDAKDKAMQQLVEGGLDGWEYVTVPEEWIEHVTEEEPCSSS